MPTRKEQAINKFESTMTENQRAIIKKHLLTEAFCEAERMMRDKDKARLYPTIQIPASATGIRQLMYNYGWYSRQLWAMGDDGNWTNYKYGV